MEKLICNCKDDKGEPDSSNHFQYLDGNGEIVVECGKCGRFIKLHEPSEGVQHRDEYLTKQEEKKTTE